MANSEFQQEQDFNKEDEKTVAFIKSKYSSAETAQNKDINRFSRYNSLYRNKQTLKNYPMAMSNLFVPEPHRVVVRKTAKIVNSIKGVNVTSEEEKDKPASKIGTILANFLTRKLAVKNFYRMWIKDSRIVGLSWAKITWDLSSEEKKSPWKGYKIDLFSVDRVFVQPRKTLLDVFQGKVDWIILEYESDIETLKQNENYNKKTIDIIEKGGGQKLKDTSLSQSREIFRTGKSSNENKVQTKHSIKEYWGKKDSENKLIVIADDKWVLRDDKNPYEDILDNPIPIVPMPASLEPHELFPIGDIEPNESLFNELNDTRNQRMDTVTLNIDPAKIVLRSANIKDKDLVSRRGWTIKSDIPNGVQFVPPDMQGVVASINEEKIIRSDIQQSTGIIDFAQDGGTSAGLNIDTARGAIVAKGESDILTEDEIAIVKEALRHFWRIMMAYAQTFLDRSFTIQFINEGVEQFHTVDKEKIKGNIDIDIDIETLQDKTTRQQMTMLLFNLAKEVPGAKIGKFFTDMLLSFKENIQITDYFEEPQPIPEKPNINISLKGELSALQSGELYKMTGADPAMADPLLSKEGRQLIQGKFPEDEEKLAEAEKDKAQADKFRSETVKNLTEEKNERIK